MELPHHHGQRCFFRMNGFLYSGLFPSIGHPALNNDVRSTAGMFAISQQCKHILDQRISARAMAPGVEIFHRDKHSSRVPHNETVADTLDKYIALNSIITMYQSINQSFTQSHMCRGVINAFYSFERELSRKRLSRLGIYTMEELVQVRFPLLSGYMRSVHLCEASSPSHSW